MTDTRKADVLLLVLCGLPASGKTTLASALTAAAVQHQVCVQQNSLDNLLASNSQDHGSAAGQESYRFTADAWQGSRKQLLQHVEVILQQHGQQQSHQRSSQQQQQAWKQQQQRCLADMQHQPNQDQNVYPCQQEQPTAQSQLAGIPQQQQQQHLYSPHTLAVQVQRQVQVQQQQEWQPLLLIIDDVNHYRSMRYEFLQLARQYQACFIQLYLDCPLDAALQHNKARAGQQLLPDDVLHKLAAAFEAPAPEKHLWEAQHTLQVHSSSLLMLQHRGGADGLVAVQEATERLWHHVTSCWGPPAPASPSEAELAARREAGSTANAASELHAADLATRALLSSTLANVNKAVRAELAGYLNQQRKQVLNSLRSSLRGANATGVQASTAPNDASDDARSQMVTAADGMDKGAVAACAAAAPADSGTKRDAANNFNGRPIALHVEQSHCATKEQAVELFRHICSNPATSKP
eukprot:GHRR01019022.1.p1 GENE.GHRR01019022.1~~GHRR01019022.1.p1  ORF type:complete len:466 (+),score=202.45 GHRR01019022.1:224-1621(+)